MGVRTIELPFFIGKYSSVIILPDRLEKSIKDAFLHELDELLIRYA
jgi:hypothetical protein